MLRKLFFLSLSVLLSGALSAQVGQGGIKGSVKDLATGEPLPFVNVVIS